MSEPPVLPPAPAGVTYRDFIFETATITAPTATKTQSKLWFAHGRWWAGLFQPTTNQVNIFRLDWELQLWEDTGTLVDERSFADPDFLWTGEHLYVVTAGPRPSQRHAARILRFSYDSEGERFVLDPNFPVTIADYGMTASVVTVDGTGVVWVAFVHEGRVWVVHSLDHDAIWGEPFPLPVSDANVDPEDVASVTAFGPGRIGVMWSNQLAGRVLFSYHEDGAPDDSWSDPEIIVDGQNQADDHINLKAFGDGDEVRVVAAIKTSNDVRQPVAPLAPQILLAVRGVDGTWATHQVSRVQDKHTRAIVMVDEAARMFVVAATSPANGGAILYKRTPIDAISFDAGKGTDLVASDLDTRISNASSTKQPMTPESGLLVLASDNQSGRYLHGLVDLGAGLPAADPTDPTRPERPEAPRPLSPITLVRNDFEPWSPGSPKGTNWVVRDSDPPAALSIVDDTAGGRSLRLEVAPDGVSTRACRAFPERPDTGLRVDLRFRLGAATRTSDAAVLSLRGSGGEAVSIRITDGGDFAWFSGETKNRATAPFRAGDVYRIVADVDQAGRRFGFRIFDAEGTRLVRETDVGWRTPDVPAIREICLETATGGPGQAIDLLDVEVLGAPAA